MNQKFTIWDRNEYHYERAGDFLPCLTARIHEDGERHPAMLIVPGGVYVLLSIGETEFVARKFYELGYNTFVLSYTNNVTLDTPPRYQPMKDASRSVRYLRKNADILNIDPTRIAVCGFSAGGHLAGCLAVHYGDVLLEEENAAYRNFSNRPDAVILNYPMISGKDMEQGPGLRTLMGSRITEDEMDYLSVNLHVTDHTPPMFLIHGLADTTVSCKQTCLMLQACLEKGVPCEAHFLMGGAHGVTTADGTAEDARSSHYAFDQLYAAVQAMTDEEYKQYEPLLAPLTRDCSYEEFIRFMSPGGMMKLFFRALGIGPEEMRKMSAVSHGDQALMAHEWFRFADDWVKKVTG